MRAYLKLAVIVFIAVVVQKGILREGSLLEDVRLGARSAYLERFGTERERREFEAELDRSMWQARELEWERLRHRVVRAAARG
jgi:hypothetical protein